MFQGVLLAILIGGEIAKAAAGEHSTTLPRKLATVAHGFGILVRSQPAR